MKLDLDYLEDKTRYATSAPTTAITKAELAALVKIVKLVVAYHDAPRPQTGAALFDALREAGL